MRIAKVGVVGAGAMGTGIAAQAASAGLPVVLLDVPGDKDRNERATGALQRALKARPAPFMDPDRAALVTPGNTEDHLERLADCDWIVEAIIERPEPKRELFGRLESIVGPEAVISSNTSGIPIASLAEGRSRRFRERFIGTHFFNPVRYLHLLELIPTADTRSDVVSVMRTFSQRMLGKGVVIAHDVPGFIANRLGLFGIFTTLRLMEEFGLTIDEVDALTGPLIGRPKSATFRTADISGLDVLAHVSEGLSQTTGEDFSLPGWVHDLVRQGKLGEKTGVGFYRKDGKQILTLDWKTGEYRPQTPPAFAELASLQRLPLDQRLRALTTAEGRAAEFLRTLLFATAHYTLEKTPELAPDLVSVDRALEWGFAWEMGPYRMFDAMGLDWLRGAFAQRELAEPPLLREARESFYRSLGNGRRQLTLKGEYVPIDAIAGHIELAAVRQRVGPLAQNDDASILDIGDGVLLVEFHGKMNTMGEGTMAMLERAVSLAHSGRYAGLVLGNDDPRTFSAGANLANVVSAVQAGKWDEIARSAKTFQDVIMSVRRAPVPVVSAAFGLTLGGGAELTLHADRVQANAELYIGLVEVGVGILPAGGGTKELLFRFTRDLAPYEEADPFEGVKRAFKLISMATTSTSALEARTLGFLNACDRVSMNRDTLISDAKARVLDLAVDYAAPAPMTIRALGREGLGNLEYAVWGMRQSKYITDHEVTIGRKIAYVLCGGDGPSRDVTEQDILDLELEALLSLLGTVQTQERIVHMLKTGKPLRN